MGTSPCARVHVRARSGAPRRAGPVARRLSTSAGLEPDCVRARARSGVPLPAGPVAPRPPTLAGPEPDRFSARARSGVPRWAGPVERRLSVLAGPEPGRVRARVVVPLGGDPGALTTTTPRLRPGVRAGCRGGDARHPEGGARRAALGVVAGSVGPRGVRAGRSLVRVVRCGGSRGPFLEVCVRRAVDSPRAVPAEGRVWCSGGGCERGGGAVGRPRGVGAGGLGRRSRRPRGGGMGPGRGKPWPCGVRAGFRGRGAGARCLFRRGCRILEVWSSSGTSRSSGRGGRRG